MAAIEKEFRERLCSEDSDKNFKEENLEKLTARQIKGAMIKKHYLQEKLKRVTNAFKYVQSTGTKVDADILQRYEQVRKKVAKKLSICINFLQAPEVKTPEESRSASPVKTEEDKKFLLTPLYRRNMYHL